MQLYSSLAGSSLFAGGDAEPRSTPFALKQQPGVLRASVVDGRAAAFGPADDGDALAAVHCHRRLDALQQTITADRAKLLAAALVEAVRCHEGGGRLLGATGREMERIMAVEGAAVTEGPR